MTIAFDGFETLKRQIEDLKRRRDKAAGARDQILKRIQKEFRCRTIKEALVLLEKLKEKERKAGIRYHNIKKRFDKKWAKRLKELL